MPAGIRQRFHFQEALLRHRFVQFCSGMAWANET